MTRPSPLQPTKKPPFLDRSRYSACPLSPKRQIELEETLKHSKAKRIYVSAFPDFREFKRHVDNIAWETEVWIENNPDHMIHFNGPKLFSAYNN
ncbi:MAG: BsuBI/PstI family type II restriction endonuclease [Candidatus Jordarchaeum sp.]|uniref:BsuBI/PstI family type II restriction endonuclease n=1 Tax=Candidatus Jordarchaeum sp. TaxID=2823881 RepID=UPI00404A2DD6